MSRYLLDLTHRPQLVVHVSPGDDPDGVAVLMAQAYANQTGREVTLLDDDDTPAVYRPHSIAAPPPAPLPVSGVEVAPVVPKVEFSLGSLGIDWNSIWNAVRPILQTVEPAAINALAAWLQSLLTR